MRFWRGHLLWAVVQIAGCGAQAQPNSGAPGSTTHGLHRLSAGASHTCAVTAGARIACWGSNVDGQLGDGDTVDQSRPVLVLGLEGAVAISAGSYHVCALTQVGNMQCWGWDSYGQVGEDGSVAQTSASQVGSLTGLVAIAAGGYHSCALLTDGTGLCWGQNDVGQLGDGAELDSTAPVAVFSLPRSNAIAAGGRHACTVVHDSFNDGTVQCWGANGAGELGDGTAQDSPFPTLVAGVSDAILVTTGFTHSCALRRDGEVLCWGANDHGQLGDAGQSGSGSAVPVMVAGLRATNIAAGYNHTCAIVADGGVECWGANGAGQVWRWHHGRPPGAGGRSRTRRRGRHRGWQLSYLR